MANQLRTDEGPYDGRDAGQGRLPKVRIKVETTNGTGETWSCDINFENPPHVHDDMVQELRGLITKLLRVETIRNVKRAVIVEDGPRSDTGRGRSTVGPASSVTISRGSPTRPVLNPKALPFSPVTRPNTPVRITKPSVAATNDETKVNLAVKQTRPEPQKQDAVALSVERWNSILSSDPPLRDMLTKRGHKVYEFYELEDARNGPDPGHVESQENNKDGNTEKSMENRTDSPTKERHDVEVDGKEEGEVVVNKLDPEPVVTPPAPQTTQESAHVNGSTDESKRQEEGRSQPAPGPTDTPMPSNKGMTLIDFDEVVAADPPSKAQEQASNTAFVPPPANPKPQPITQASRKILDPLIWSQFEKFQLSITSQKPDNHVAGNAVPVAVDSSDSPADDTKKSSSQLSAAPQPQDPDCRSSQTNAAEMRTRQVERHQSQGSV
ncbi:hypothetical protein ACRALDRAFT_1067178, partial [Sodiomyces alcalophilus JCM 7366]|uniref:uncharacterized protein n=1 Tax=Sodiomyces alcalophilus JCM 7366 TaxID=591952 RepID=UPI0039B3C672